MTRKKWRLRRHFCSLRLPMQTSIWIRMAPELNQDVWRGQKNFQTTCFTMINNVSYMKHALKSATGLADGGVPYVDGDNPRTTPRCLDVARKKFQMTILTISNNCSKRKCTKKSTSGLADVGVLHGDGDGPRTPPRCLEGSGKSFK